MGAGIARREGVFLAFSTHGRHQSNAVGQLQGGFEALGQSLLQPLLDFESIDHNVNLVLALLVQGRNVVYVAYGSVHSQADEALAAHGVDHLQMLTFAIPDHRRQYHQLAAFRHGENLVNHLAHGLGFQRLAVIRTAGFTSASEKQSQIVIDLGDGPHGRAGVVRRGFLLDGDGWRQAFNVIHIGLFHHREELPCVGGQRLDIPALALGIERIERQ